MKHEKLNTQQIRDLLDYVEAEAMAGVYEARRGGGTHPEFATALENFIGKYDVVLPVVATDKPLSPEKIKKVQGAFLQDWQAHQAAMQTLRPLFDLILAVADGEPKEEQSRLHRAAFPQGFGAFQD